MAAGVSITDSRSHRWINSLVVGVFLVVAGCGGVAYRSDSYYEETYRCPMDCACFTVKQRERVVFPRVLINCTVSAFGPNVNFEMPGETSNEKVGWAHFLCRNGDPYVTPPDSALWDGAFANLKQLRELIFNGCYFQQIKGSTFRGLDLLNQLVIYGASISILDSDLLTSTPSLKNLQVAASGLTLVPALCNTGSHLRVLNLSENALPSFDAAGVRCTGHGSGHSRIPPLAGLETLDVRNNLIKTWPPWLGASLPGLIYLAVGNNLISNFGHGLAGLSRLTYFDMSNNSVPSFDAGFFKGASENLETVILSRNKVHSLPPGLFSPLPKLRHVGLSGMDLGDEVWNQLDGMRHLLHLDLSHNRLRHLKYDVIAGLTILKSVYLNHNQISSLPSEAFKTQSRLQTLDLSYNQLRSVPAQAFNSSTGLMYLYLQHNRIQNLANGILQKHSDLVILDISHNNLSSLPDHLITGKEDLLKLDLSGNQLNVLADNIFESSKYLLSLNVSHNRLSRLPAGSLSPRLVYVDFSHNQASSPIAADMFNGLIKVNEIHLGHNKLTSLPLQIFGSCRELKYLDLSHNDISFVEELMFANAVSLEEIDLSYNQLTDIGRVFKDLEHLKVLNLARNKLTSIIPYQFPPKIHHIDLSNNLISSIQDRSFSYLLNIRTVDLSANKLSRINVKGVETSYRLITRPEFVIRFNPLVCDCHLGWLKDWLMGTSKTMETLPSFTSPTFLSCESPFHGNTIKVAQAERSSFLCKYDRFCSEGCTCCSFDCHCHYICPQGCQCYRGDSVLRVQRVECQAAGLTQVPSLPDGATELRLDGNNITEFNKFTFVAMKDAFDVFLNHSHLQRIHDCDFWGMKRVRRLYLNDNLLRTLEVGAFTGLYKLEELHLHGNKLSGIESGSLLSSPTLISLTLHSNSLVTLPVDDLYELVSRSNASSAFTNRSCSRSRREASHGGLSLTLRDNPWSCEPSFACSFLSYLQVNSDSIEDLQLIQCIPEPQVVAFVPGDYVGRQVDTSRTARFNGSSRVHRTRGRKILDLQLDVCNNGLGRDNNSLANVTGARIDSGSSDNQKYMLIAMCVLVALVLALLLAVFLNRHILQVICFTRFGCRAFKPGKDADKKDAAGDDRPYDAFVCHSNKDDDFVLQQLAPRLETGEKPFRLCLHYRDIPGGACMGDAIVRSVQASKRTILVISENFLESEYCKAAFQEVCNEIKREKKSRMIILLLGDLDLNKVKDNDPNVYLRMRSYLKVGEPLFWETFEFQVAHEQLMREKKSRMIILLLGNLDPAKVKDKDLKLYLRTRTYLKVGEPLFWQKLVFAMPDLSTQQHRRRPSGAKGNTPAGITATRLPSSRDLEYMDRERRLSEQQKLQQEMEQQQHLFELQQQQLLLQQQHPQVMAHTPLIQYPHHNYPPHPQHQHQEHHQQLLHHHHYHDHHHPQYVSSHYEEQQVHPQHQQPAMLHSQPYPQHQLAVSQERAARPEMYEIPSLDSQPDSQIDSQYHLAKTGSVPRAPQINFLPKVISGYPGVDSPQVKSFPPTNRGVGGDDRASGTSGSLRSTHVNSAFNNSDDSSTSGYHNGSADSCSVCGGHYEEVGPGSSVMNTPIKFTDQRLPPPVPRIPKEGFVPIDRDDSVNTC